MMHRRGALAIALAAAGWCPAAPVHAVRVNPDGHGQALVYPYYTARSSAAGNAYVTAIAVTNATARPKALKVRFLEGKVGTPVLDFNLFLAAYDVWTAGVVGAGAGAGIFCRACCHQSHDRRSIPAVAPCRRHHDHQYGDWTNHYRRDGDLLRPAHRRLCGAVVQHDRVAGCRGECAVELWRGVQSQDGAEDNGAAMKRNTAER